MSDLEAAVRAAIHDRLQLARQPDVPEWDDEAVARILAAHPGGMIAADAPDAASGLVRDLAAEIIATFTKGSDGYRARVSQEQISKWRERLGQPA